MYASWHVDSRVVDVAVTASNRQVMKWCGYGMLWRWLHHQTGVHFQICRPLMGTWSKNLEHKVVAG